MDAEQKRRRDEAPANDGTWYLLFCRVCGGPLIPFTSPQERGRWAVLHTEGTGHERWGSFEEPRPPEEGD